VLRNSGNKLRNYQILNKIEENFRVASAYRSTKKRLNGLILIDNINII
jgi:hypothetical protein